MKHIFSPLVIILSRVYVYVYIYMFKPVVWIAPGRDFAYDKWVQ